MNKPITPIAASTGPNQPWSKMVPAVCLSLCLVLCLAMSASAQARLSNKWRLQFSGNAESDGVITLRFVPKKGVASVTETSIRKGKGENAVARAVVKSLQAQLPREQYHIERDDGEDVLVKRRFGAERFDVEIISITVKGVRINPDRE